MNNVRWVVAGFALGLVMAVAPACGAFGEEKCTASTCQGCCNEDGKCETGTLTNACGLNGGACAVCAATDICQGGFCTPIGSNNNNNNDGGNNNNTDGGNNNTDGGTSCNASNCADGCCVGNVCRRGADNNNLTCGLGGQACQQCTGTLTCSAGECRDTTCNGCVSNGSCVTGTSTTACGFGGLACSVCTSGQSCTNGVCTGGSSCSPSNCSGCCQNGVCQTGTSTSACGLNGSTCSSCTTGQTCTSGSCQTTTTTVKYASPCSLNTDCSTLGAGAYCKKTTSSGNATYPGGYCTKTCAAAGDCGTGGQCGWFGEWGEGDQFCLGNDATLCASRGTAYANYGTSPNNFCWLNPPPTANTPPSGVAGSSCSTDAPCTANNAYAAGFCITQWSSGYCSGDCSNSGVCASDATCLLVSDNSTPSDPNDDISYCFKSCTTAGQSAGVCTRVGYTCRATSAGSTQGYCGPKCASSTDCPSTHTTCNTATGFCCDSATGQCI